MYSLRSNLSSMKKSQTRESWTQLLQAFQCVLLDVFCSCVCRDLCSRGKRVATWSSRCVLSSLCRHTYVQCVLFFWAQMRKSRCETYENRMPCFLSNSWPWRFRLVCLQKQIIFFLPTKYNFNNSVSLNAFTSKPATTQWSWGTLVMIYNFLLIELSEGQYRHFRLCANCSTFFHFSS